MKYVKFEGNLRAILGEDAIKISSKYGVEVTPEYQFLRPQEGVLISLGTVIDQNKAEALLRLENITALADEKAFNAEIDKYYKPSYQVTSDALYAENLKKLIGDGIIDLNEMKPTWTDAEENEYLYNAGVSGIEKSKKLAYK